MASEVKLSSTSSPIIRLEHPSKNQLNQSYRRRIRMKKPNNSLSKRTILSLSFLIVFQLLNESFTIASAERTTIVSSSSSSVQPRFQFPQRRARNQNSSSSIRNPLIRSTTTTTTGSGSSSSISSSNNGVPSSTPSYSQVSVLRPTRVTYADIERTNKTCTPKDTCASSRHDRNGAMMNDPKKRNCFCDQQCIVYEDCCIDSPYRRDPNVNYKKNELFQCVALRQFGSLYMKTKCPSSWKDETVRKGCEDDRTTTYDPISALPVTNMISGFTFKNYFCALCNNQSFSERMEVWKPRIECPSISTKDFENASMEEILNKLEYRSEEGRWGLSIKRRRVETWNACGIDPVVPVNVEHLVRFCKPAIKECPSNYSNIEIHRKCLSYTGTVYHLQEGYRNVHCAICNGILPENLFCSPHGTSRSAFHFEFNQAAFSMLFDLNPASGTEVGRIKKCTKDEIYDPFFQKCRSILCQSGQYYKNGHCYRSISRTTTPSSTSTTSGATSTKGSSSSTSSRRPYEDLNSNDLDNDDDDELSSSSTNTNLEYSRRKKGEEAEARYYENCPKITLDGSEYQILDNGSVYIIEYQQVLSKRNYALQGNDILIICAPKEATSYYIDKFGAVWGYITFTCVFISIICLLLHLIATCCISELRNLAGKNIASLSVALLIVYSIFLGMPFVSIPSSSCTAMAMILYYSFISAFCWMLILGWDVSTTLRRATVELRISSGSQWTRFICYSTFGWLFPALMTIITIVGEFLPDYMKFPYSPRFGQQNCWFGQKPALLIYFVGPVGFILLLNVILFIDAARIIASTTHGTSKAKVCGPSHKNFKLYLRLGLLMGISWILGIVAGFVDNTAVWIIFTIFNTLQGLFIFIAFTCTSKVYKALRAKMCCLSNQPANGSWTWSGIVGANGNNGDRNNMVRTVSDSSSSNATKRSDLIDPSDSPTNSHHESFSQLHHHHNDTRHTPSPIYNPHLKHQSINSVRLGGKQIGGIMPRVSVSSPIYRSSTTEMYIS